jgi:hypothetical protein
MKRRFDSPVRRIPADPHGYFLREVSFQLELQGIVLTEDVAAEITSYYVAGVSPVAAVALILALPPADD